LAPVYVIIDLSAVTCGDHRVSPQALPTDSVRDHSGIFEFLTPLGVLSVTVHFSRSMCPSRRPWWLCSGRRSHRSDFYILPCCDCFVNCLFYQICDFLNHGMSPPCIRETSPYPSRPALKNAPCERMPTCLFTKQLSDFRTFRWNAFCPNSFCIIASHI